MMFSTFWPRSGSSKSRSSARGHPRPRHPAPARPRLDLLEDRTLLSVCLVDRLTDLGEGKELAGDLRYCIEQAQDKDSIQFAVKGRIGLARELPELIRSISIEGPGPELLTVRGYDGGFFRILTVSSGATVTISGLTISSETSIVGDGGGILNLGTLMISNSTIYENEASRGGGIANAGTLVVSGSTISDNGYDSPVDAGGGIFNSGTLTVINSSMWGNQASEGGGIANEGTLTVINSTISGNFTFGPGRGGGISNRGTLTVSNSTISGNRSVEGGGIINFETLHMRNTILAGNTAPSGPDLSGTLTSSGYNLIGNTEGGDGYDYKTDLLDLDPLLGPLENNGGSTWTHVLLPGSPAIDSGDNTDAPEWDQRGEGFPRIVNDVIDRGAFEVQVGAAPGARAGRSPAVPDPLLATDLVGGLTWRRARPDFLHRFAPPGVLLS